MRTIEQLTQFVAGSETYTVHDHEDITRNIKGATWDQAMDMVYSMHGTYTVTNERNDISSTYTYR